MSNNPDFHKDAKVIAWFMGDESPDVQTKEEKGFSYTEYIIKGKDGSGTITLREYNNGGGYVEIKKRTIANNLRHFKWNDFKSYSHETYLSVDSRVTVGNHVGWKTAAERATVMALEVNKFQML
jgi:hypothetical protein